MKSSNPPRLAVWLLENYGPEVNQEALAGDLYENFSQGRSSGWYWRQVLSAIRWRKHLFRVLLIVAASWALTMPELRHGSIVSSRSLDMFIIMSVSFVSAYLSGKQRGWVRVALAALIVVVFVLLYRYDSNLADHYSLYAMLFVNALVFHQKKREPAPVKLTWRELLKGDPSAERRRMISVLERNLLQETDPTSRQAYELSIAKLQSSESRQLPKTAE